MIQAHHLLFSTGFTIPYTHTILKFIWDRKKNLLSDYSWSVYSNKHV